MKTFILFMCFNSYTHVCTTQEFNNKELCESARWYLYKERDRVHYNLGSAFCLEK